MKIKENIPNFITSLNLASGMLGISFIIKDQVLIAVYLVFLAGILDFLDGAFANLLNASTNIGKSLDSLADVVSFGVLPAAIFFKALSGNSYQPEFIHFLIPYLAILVPVLSAIRLAVFNNDESQQTIFRGLPTPANAFLLTSSVYIYINSAIFGILNPVIPVVVLIAGSILMVTRIKMISFKTDRNNKKAFWMSFSLLFISLVLIIWLGIPGVFFSVLLYILLSLFLNK